MARITELKWRNIPADVADSLQYRDTVRGGCPSLWKPVIEAAFTEPVIVSANGVDANTLYHRAAAAATAYTKGQLSVKRLADGSGIVIRRKEAAG